MIYLNMHELDELAEAIKLKYPDIAEKLNQMKDAAKAHNRNILLLDDIGKYHLMITVSEDDITELLKKNDLDVNEETRSALRDALDGFDFQSDLDDALNYIMNDELDNYLQSASNA